MEYKQEIYNIKEEDILSSLQQSKQSLEFVRSNNKFVIGTEDEYYSEKKIDKHIEELNNKGLDFELIKFKGAHTIDSETLLNLM